jgi:TRAP-type C4-dicarboxylate transport system permease small subunit
MVRRWSQGITDALALLGAAGVALMLVHITADVVMRQLFRLPLPATVEIVSRYYMVMVAFLGLPWAERRGDAIRVELLAPLLSGWLARPNRILVRLACIGAYALLAYTSWTHAVGEWRSGTYVISLQMQVPVWPSYFLLPVAFALAAAVSVEHLLRGDRP